MNFYHSENKHKIKYVHFLFRLDKKTKDLVLAENSARMYENRCADINGKYNTAVLERKKATDDCKVSNVNEHMHMSVYYR